METRYSILMSVYHAESPDNLEQSIQSMMNQTLYPDQFVLVCDGPLTEALDRRIDLLKAEYQLIETVVLPENLGLGRALNAGLRHCRNELVVRLDSDDISFSDRCEKQVAFMQKNNLDLSSAIIEEFTGELQVMYRRTLPLTHEEIVRFAKKRNPFNHSCSIYRKSVVEKAGGYRDMFYFEDYDLWARMILMGARLGNMDEPLLYVRAGEDMFRRRAGLGYCRHIIRFWTEMRRLKFCSIPRCLSNIVIRCAVSLAPAEIIEQFYKNNLRS